MPPKRLIKKLSGQKEIYTIAVRRAPKGEGCDPLPALGEEPYTRCPTPPHWYADPPRCMRMTTANAGCLRSIQYGGEPR